MQEAPSESHPTQNSLDDSDFVDNKKADARRTGDGRLEFRKMMGLVTSLFCNGPRSFGAFRANGL